MYIHSMFSTISLCTIFHSYKSQRVLVMSSNPCTFSPRHRLSSEKTSMLRNATWTLSNLCRGKPPPPFEWVRDAEIGTSWWLHGDLYHRIVIEMVMWWDLIGILIGTLWWFHGDFMGVEWDQWTLNRGCSKSFWDSICRSTGFKDS